MTGLKSAMFGAILPGVFLATTTARAQDVVPGGWSSEVGVEQLTTPNPYTQVSPYGMTLTAASRTFAPVNALMLPPGRPASQPQVVNALGPLADVVRKAPRRRKAK